jgi:transketolase
VRDAFIRALTRLATADERVMLITGDLGFGVLDHYSRDLPAQFLNAGIAEQNMTGLATGMALEGHVVFTYSIGNFPTLRCLEQIRNDACYHGANVNIVAVGGGFSYGQLGMSHHATEDIAIMRALPDIVVATPSDQWEVEQLVPLLAAHPGTTYLRLDKSTSGAPAAPGESLSLGRARVLRIGSDLTIIGVGGVLEHALAASEAMAILGANVGVISMPTVKPIDEECILRAARETGGIITLEEHSATGGLGSAVADVCLEHGTVPRIFRKIAHRAGFSSIVGSQQYLRQQYGLDEPAVMRVLREALSQRSRDSADRLRTMS